MHHFGSVFAQLGNICFSFNYLLCLNSTNLVHNFILQRKGEDDDNKREELSRALLVCNLQLASCYHANKLALGLIL